MLSTSIAVLAAIALLMPGFIVAELAQAGSARAPRSDLEISLRALVYTIFLHLLFIEWTASRLGQVGSAGNWAHHVGALVLYAVVVLIAAPALLGTVLNLLLARAERGEKPPNRWMAALGAGASGDAFDFAFQQVKKDGAWVVMELVGHTEQEPRLLGGIFGGRSAIGQTPSAHDVYLEKLCTVTRGADGLWMLDRRGKPDRGVYLPAAQIARIEFLPATGIGTLPS